MVVQSNQALRGISQSAEQVVKHLAEVKKEVTRIKSIVTGEEIPQERINELCNQVIRAYTDTFLYDRNCTESMNYLYFSKLQSDIGTEMKYLINYTVGNNNGQNVLSVVHRCENTAKLISDYCVYIIELIKRLEIEARLIKKALEEDSVKVENIIKLYKIINETVEGYKPTQNNQTIHYLTKVTTIPFLAIHHSIGLKNREIGMSYRHGSHPYTSKNARAELIDYIKITKVDGIRTIYEAILEVQK